MIEGKDRESRVEIVLHGRNQNVAPLARLAIETGHPTGSASLVSWKARCQILQVAPYAISASPLPSFRQKSEGLIVQAFLIAICLQNEGQRR